MIKIAFIVDTIESPTAGTEKQLLLLIKHLDRTKFEPYLCVLKSSAWLIESFTDCPLHVVGISSFKKMGSYWKIWRFSRFLRSHQIDIVQTYFNDSNKVGILAAKLAGRSSVISSRRNQGYWHTAAELSMLKLLNKWVDIFVTNSFSTKQWAMTVEEIAEEKIKVIYNGYEFSIMHGDVNKNDRITYRRAWGVSTDTKVIGLVANLRPVKRHDIFLRAAQIIQFTYPDTYFVLIGEGSERQTLECLASDLNISNVVYFMGQCDNVATILSAIDIGVLSSDSESFSNAVVEYLAAGLPVVSTDVGGSREAIEPGENGYIVPVGDYSALAEAVCKVLYEKRTTEMGKVSRMKVESFFTMKAMVSQYENLYVALRGNVIS